MKRTDGGETKNGLSESIVRFGGVILVLFALFAAARSELNPLRQQIDEISRQISVLSGAGKLLTDYKENTIEKLTRAEEKLRALVEQVHSDQLVTDDHIKGLREQMAFEIANQVLTRVEQVKNVTEAVDKLNVRLLAITEDGRSQLAMIVSLQAKMDIMMKERDALTALKDAQQRKEFDKP